MNKTGKGTNPNSHNNKPKIGKEGGQAREVVLSAEQWAIVREIGKGNQSRGVRHLLGILEKLEAIALLRNISVDLLIPAFELFSREYPDSLPYPQSLIFYLQRKAAEGDEEAQKHLEYLESWGADVDMREMLGEGSIKVKDSYIV